MLRAVELETSGRGGVSPQKSSWNITGAGVDVSFPVTPHRGEKEQISAFGLGGARASAVRYGDGENDVLDLLAGSTVNCEKVELCCHGNGTHTEGIGHIVKERISVLSCKVPFMCLALVVSVTGVQADGEDSDEIISEQALEQACAIFTEEQVNAADALVVRTLGKYEPDSNRGRNYSGTNPPYFSQNCMHYMVQNLGVKHLMVDLPSVDKEQSGSTVPNHAIFFGIEPGCTSAEHSKRKDCTITELANLHAGLQDGLHLLSLQVAPIEMDAAPSRPILYPCTAT